MWVVRWVIVGVVSLCFMCPCANGQAVTNETPSVKTQSVLYPAEMIEKARANAAKYEWAAQLRDQIVKQAEPWLKMSDKDLWDLMFGPGITRSWMVWSDGFCPSCKRDVKMYTWEMDPWTMPWKVRCPHCKEVFPKNDFKAFFDSGCDERGVFSQERADRSLLFNKEHPDPNDSLHMFGVDDGEGYADAEGHRWRFMGCYQIYGQWKKWILAGITSLSEAYLVTGEPQYARKAIILLDRVADLYPLFDFSKQALVYETNNGVHGQISTWHDACREVFYLATAYDRVFEAGRAQEADLAAFLAPLAASHQVGNPKKSWNDIQRNIEEGIFRDTLAHRERIESNYPTTDCTIVIIKTILNWPDNREEILGLLDAIIAKATAVDGVSGEKGLAGYSTIAPTSVASLLGLMTPLDPGFLQVIYDRHPILHQTFRFHIDTWCMEQFYPNSGDSGGMCGKIPRYCGVSTSGFGDASTEPSMSAFLWNLYEITKDTAFVQALFLNNGSKIDGLPHDLFADDPSVFQANVKTVIDEVGSIIPLGSVNKQQWRIALLRSGKAENRRVLWIDYDAGERHSHADGMNIGLFAKGLELIPEFGYPPVGYGGWGSQKAVWYTKTAAHVTVVVDGKDQKRINSGVTTLWGDGQCFRLIRVSDPALIEGKRYERTVALIDLDENDSYVIDYFLVEGGRDHAKFFHSVWGTVETQGLTLQDTEDYGYATEMRHFRRDPSPSPGWSVDWAIDDRNKYLPEGKKVHLRYTDLTTGAAAHLAEAWVDTVLYGSTGGEYIPCVMTRRSNDGQSPLLSAFVSVIEPYDAPQPRLTQIRRLPVQAADGAALQDTAVALEIMRDDGARDMCLIAPPESVGEVVEPVNGVRLTGAVGFATIRPEGVERLILCKGSALQIGSVSIRMKQPVEYIEIVVGSDGAMVVAGQAADIERVTRDGTPVVVSEMYRESDDGFLQRDSPCLLDHVRGSE